MLHPLSLYQPCALCEFAIMVLKGPLKIASLGEPVWPFQESVTEIPKLEGNICSSELKSTSYPLPIMQDAEFPLPIAVTLFTISFH